MKPWNSLSEPQKLKAHNEIDKSKIFFKINAHILEAGIKKYASSLKRVNGRSTPDKEHQRSKLMARTGTSPIGYLLEHVTSTQKNILSVTIVEWNK